MLLLLLPGAKQYPAPRVDVTMARLAAVAVTRLPRRLVKIQKYVRLLGEIHSDIWRRG